MKFGTYHNDGMKCIDFSSFRIGVFKPWGNYLEGEGWELFCVSFKRMPRILKPFFNWQIGWTKRPYGSKFFSVKYDTAFRMRTVRIGRFGYGALVPKFLAKILKRRAEKKIDALFEGELS